VRERVKRCGMSHQDGRGTYGGFVVGQDGQGLLRALHRQVRGFIIGRKNYRVSFIRDYGVHPAATSGYAPLPASAHSHRCALRGYNSVRSGVSHPKSAQEGLGRSRGSRGISTIARISTDAAPSWPSPASPHGAPIPLDMTCGTCKPLGDRVSRSNFDVTVHAVSYHAVVTSVRLSLAIE
jgi:hypothetical protein